MNKHNELTKTVAKLEKLKIDSIFKIAVSILKGDESRALNIINKIKTKKELRIVDLNLTQNNNIVFSDLIKTEKYIKIISDKGITPKSIELVG
jgi:hypothetical protein